MNISFARTTEPTNNNNQYNAINITGCVYGSKQYMLNKMTERTVHIHYILFVPLGDFERYTEHSAVTVWLWLRIIVDSLHNLTQKVVWIIGHCAA